jgi:hypothetical protein
LQRIGLIPVKKKFTMKPIVISNMARISRLLLP